MLSSAHVAAILAFAMWGLFPVYWKAFSEVPAWDLFAHRLLWSFITLMLILTIRKKLGSLRSIWSVKKTRWMLMLSALMISSNWLLYIYSVNVGKVLEASMGYFLNPLINVFLGWVILKERIRPGQWPSIILGATAMVLIALQSDLEHFPWLALVLSLTFALYGLIRKVAHVGSLEGLAFETTVMILPALIVWQFLPSTPLTAIQLLSPTKIVFLVLSGVITCAPLVLFAYGARRLSFGTLGFIQYLSPSLKFVCGWLIFHEALGKEKLQAFVLIWVALALYTIESLVHIGRRKITVTNE